MPLRGLEGVPGLPGAPQDAGGMHGNPLQYSCLENPRDGGAWWAAVHGVVQRTRCPDTSLKATLWMKAQHEGALTPLCIVRKNPHPGE